MGSRPDKHRNRGFTLIELLTVITIIAILVAFVVGAGRYAKLKSLEGLAKANMQHIANALTEYQLHTARYPDTLSDTNFVAVYASKIPKNVRMDPATKVPIDPWRNPYVYTVHASKLSYTLYCRGRLPALTETSDDLVMGK